jgi:hypothetical protein
MTVVVSGGTVAAMPNPTIPIGSRNPIHNEVIGPARTMSANPTAVIVGPTISGSRAPIRSSRPPDQRDKTPHDNGERQKHRTGERGRISVHLDEVKR